jgi:hypothetical protein
MTMLQHFDRFTLFRKANCAAADSIAPELRDVIPNGLRNNIHWQLGHIVTVQASLLYKRCGLELPVPSEYLTWFAKGTSPADWAPETTPYEALRNDAGRLLDQTRGDLDRYHDARYSEPITVTGGVRLSSFADALEFLAVHEALHLGAMNVMKRILETQSES